MHGELQSLSRELSETNRKLDDACRRYGVTVQMFRTAKFLFYIATLATTMFLVSEGVEPTLAMGFAVVLISGPEALETWLIQQGTLPESAADDGSGSDNGDK